MEKTIYQEGDSRLISKWAFVFKITSCDLLVILYRIYMFCWSRKILSQKKEEKEKEKEKDKEKERERRKKERKRKGKK